MSIPTAYRFMWHGPNKFQNGWSIAEIEIMIKTSRAVYTVFLVSNRLNSTTHIPRTVSVALDDIARVSMDENFDQQHSLTITTKLQKIINQTLCEKTQPIGTITNDNISPRTICNFYLCINENNLFDIQLNQINPQTDYTG